MAYFPYLHAALESVRRLSVERGLVSTTGRNNVEQPPASVDQSDPSSPFYAPTSPGGMSLCHGCRRLNRCRLGIESEQLNETGAVISRVVCPPTEEGGPKVAHGGWTAAVMDELAGHTLTMNAEFAVTGTLTVRFVRPVPIGWQLIGRAWITEREGRRVFIKATLELESSETIVAEADAIMIKRPATHFESHYKWLEGQRRID